EITLDVVMASACLPFMFKAVEIDGVPYWDGGYMGNPVLFPFVDGSPSCDALIIQINPLERPGTPRSARDIHNRVNEITFNASLLRELRSFNFIESLIAEGVLPPEDPRALRIHMIDGAKEMLKLSASSKLNAEWSFLTHLRDIGRAAADGWLSRNFEAIGQKSTVDLSAMFADIGGPHHG
ncbi:MAG: patatin-like phospholipase family protein, partial [Pseudomonadota bacterium]